MNKLLLLSLQICYISTLIPTLKFIISENLNDLSSIDLRYDTSGMFLDFDNNSEVSFIPYEIYKIITDKYTNKELCEKKEIVVNDNQYETFWCYPGALGFFRNINLITEKYAIKISSSSLFIYKDDNYYFRFVSSRNVENFIFGKKLINLMKIEFLDNDDFIINNKECIHQFEDGN